MFISYILFLFLIEVNVVDSEFDQIFRECAGGWIYIYVQSTLHAWAWVWFAFELTKWELMYVLIGSDKI